MRSEVEVKGTQQHLREERKTSVHEIGSMDRGEGMRKRMVE